MVHILMLFSVLGACQNHHEVVFEEHFNGTTLNMAVWNYELGDGCPSLCGWGNDERQHYTIDNASIKDGELVISATYSDSVYNSSRITTKNKIEFQYGIVEVRAKLPNGHGVWPAIWMLGNDIETNSWPACGEIDIMEYVGKKPGMIHTSLHTPSSFGATINTHSTTISNLEDEFHIYKVDWSQDSIDFFIDNRNVYSYAPEIKNESTWPFDKPFYLLINMAIGGNFGGPEVDDSIFPTEFMVDYIKVYKKSMY